MELADDARTGQTIEPDTYIPRTLKEEMANHPRLPLNTSLQIALSLTSALGHLHTHGLIHRDIKPSNIIFVKGVPKLADIGLVTEFGEDVTAVGPPGFMPPEGPGEPTADIFGLGMVFYELFMGMPCKRFPELPGAAEEFTSVPELLRMNNLILRACHHDRRQRFQTANELHKALLAVTETVQEKQSIKPDTEARAKTPLPDSRVSPPKATGTTQGPTGADGEPGRKSRWTRRDALLVLLSGTTVGAFFLGKLQQRKPGVAPPDPVVVLMDTTAVGGIYDDDNKARGISNAEEIKKVLEPILDLRWLNAVPLSEAWKGEDNVIERHPRLVIVHRSAFFHSFNAFFQYGQPPQFAHPTDDPRWVKLYGFADDKLINLLAYIAAREPQTQFLVYSRGTDPNWVKPGYQEYWKKHMVESRFPNLKGRITTMTVKRGQDGKSPTFRNPETQKELLEKVKTILGLPGSESEKRK